MSLQTDIVWQLSARMKMNKNILKKIKNMMEIRLFEMKKIKKRENI